MPGDMYMRMDAAEKEMPRRPAEKRAMGMAVRTPVKGRRMYSQPESTESAPLPSPFIQRI